MVRRRTDVSKKVRVRDLSGGLLVKMDTARMPTKYARDARNLRFSGGVAETRPGSVTVAHFARASEALLFPGTDEDYVKVPVNSSCPIWTGLGPDFTVCFVERPVSSDPFPGPDEAILLALGTAGGPSFQVYSTDSLDRWVRIREGALLEGDPDVDVEIGAVDDAGDDPDDRRYLYWISREGRTLRSLIVGAAVGAQSSAWATAFVSAASKLEPATKPLYIGGYGLDGSTPGLNSRLDEIQFWNRYRQPNRRYYWSAYPVLEDPDLLLRLGFDGEEGMVERDDSLYGNHAEVVGNVLRVQGDVETLAVGQFLGEAEIGHRLHRLAMAGGACRREQVR